MSSFFHPHRQHGSGTPEFNGPKAFFQKLHQAFHPHHRPSISFSHAEDTWVNSKQRRHSISSTSETKVGSRPLLALTTRSFWRNAGESVSGADSVKLQSSSSHHRHENRRRVAQEDGGFSLEQSRHTSKSDGRSGGGGQNGNIDTRSSSTADPFSPSELLSLSDTIRTSLSENGTLGPEAGKLASFLEWALASETAHPHHPNHDHRIEFKTIQHAHLDKLISEIIFTGKEIPNPRWPLSQSVDLAEQLQRTWQARFRARYFMIDENRTTQLVKRGGALQGVCWSNSFSSPTSPISPKTVVPPFAATTQKKQQPWQVTQPKLRVDDGKPTAGEGQLESDDSFQTGDWWLTMPCARRDGMVGTEEEKVSKGRYNVFTLPLLSGKEEDIYGQGTTTRYVRTGGLRDMHVELLGLVGKQVRVLRGYLLQSGMAPRVGVRFDGIWKLASYRHKLDLGTGEYKLELSLERISGQTPMREVLKVPRPSQMDEWNLFEKLEADKVRQTAGEAAAYAWKLQREEARVEREMWKRAHKFRSSISAGSALSISTASVLSGGGPGGERQGAAGRKKSEAAIKMIPPEKVKERAEEVRAERSEKKRVRMASEASTVVIDDTTGEGEQGGEVRRSRAWISWEDVLTDALEIAKGKLGSVGSTQ
ncbi:hypothetical protein QBC36DRAFT_49776 [Triangularia setosa]|uniref:Uncharacterized protein n=1 Tax=Triangularia setosa TaxID=2587417 RepID=A0AAN6WDH4_9PEZI|nr:hypothetical protein QBC36DRAFT_49776 [Podospora setosa]